MQMTKFEYLMNLLQIMLKLITETQDIKISLV